MNLYEITRKDIDAMDGISFEELVMSMYEELGYECAKTPVSNDYGTDIIVETPVGKFSIQCKRQTSNVGIKAVQEVYGSLPKYGAVKGIVVSTSGYTANAVELAKYCNIELIDGNKLWEMITGIQNGDFVKNSKQNINEIIEELNSLISLGNERIATVENKANDVVTIASNEIEYLKNISKVVDSKMQLIEAKIEECKNITIPVPEWIKGEKGEPGEPAEVPKSLSVLVKLAVGWNVVNLAIGGYLLFKAGVLPW